MDAFDHLLELAGPALGDGAIAGGRTRLERELGELLGRRDGFYAYDSALLVRPSGSSAIVPNLVEWNARDGWRAAYGELADRHRFFAEDVFGVQFSILGDEVVSFDPETGEIDVLATSIEGWVEIVLREHRVVTGWPLARAWHEQHGPIQVGCRLVPKQPFVLGGDYELDNLGEIEAEAGMRWRGEIATQLEGLPDGTPVRLRAVE